MYDRIGYLFGRILDMTALRGGAATARVLAGASMQTTAATIAGAYNATPAYPSLFDGYYSDLAAFQNTNLGFVTALINRAQNTIIYTANADTALAAQTIANALALVNTEMISGSQTINASTVSLGAQTTVSGSTGNSNLVLSAKRYDGLTWPVVYPETVTATCTNDSQTGATLNQEPFLITGQNAATSPWAYNWPLGSGASVSLSNTDPTANNASNNALYNSSWANWSNGSSGAPPDNWNALVGAAQMARVSSPKYLGSYSVEFVGDSSTLTSMAQPFNTAVSTTLNSGGTPYKLASYGQYAAIVYYQLSGASPVAGVLEMSLVDGNNNVISDQASTQNLVSSNLHNIADTNWHVLTGTFRMPLVLPATTPYKLRLRLSTALTTGTNLYIGGVAMTPMTQLYQGGLSAAMFPGNTATVKGDGFQVAVTNTMGTFAQMLERAFRINSQLNIILPSSGSPTILDSYVQ